MLGFPNMEEYMKRWDSVHVDDAVGRCSELGDSDVGEGQSLAGGRGGSSGMTADYTTLQDYLLRGKATAPPPRTSHRYNGS